MRTTDFDAIAASAPLDRQASVVRDGSGDQFVGRIPRDVEHWTAPPLPEAARPAQVKDLSGLAVGRMTVVRYHRSHPKRGARWLVRCRCGDYEVRSTPALTGACAPERLMCCLCEQVELMRRAPARDRVEDRAADEALFERLAAEARGGANPIRTEAGHG